MEENNDVPEVIETPEEEPQAPEVEAPEPDEEVEPETPELDDKDRRIADLEEKNKKLFARAKAAEDKAKAALAPTTPQEPQLSGLDIASLVKADVHEDDYSSVLSFAKTQGISVRDALKDDELQAVLKVRSEKRASANAANTGPTRRGPSKPSDESILADAAKGKLPDDDDGINRLVSAKNKQQRS